MGGRRRLGAIRGIGIAGVFLWNWSTKQLAYSRDVLGPGAAGEEAVVTDAMEATWEDVDQEAADELVGGEGHDLLPLAPLGAVVLPLEGEAVVIERDQAGVGDGDLMGVARQIGEHRLWSIGIARAFCALCSLPPAALRARGCYLVEGYHVRPACQEDRRANQIFGD